MADKQYFVSLRTLVLGYAKDFLTMFVKRKKNRSGTTSVVIPEKSRGNYKELVTIGIAKDSSEIDSLVNAGYEWISRENSRRYPQLDLFGEIQIYRYRMYTQHITTCGMWNGLFV